MPEDNPDVPPVEDDTTVDAPPEAPVYTPPVEDAPPADAAPVEEAAPEAEEDVPPVMGDEGGMIEFGTGQYAPDAEEEPVVADAGEVVVADAYGTEFVAPLGMDGENPVTAQNPLPGAVRE